MEKFSLPLLCSTLVLFLGSCGGSRECEVASLQFDQLVATTGPIPVAHEHRLTSDDIDRLKRHYPLTLKRLQSYQPLLMQDIINLTRAGVSDSTIVYEIGVTRSAFYLTPQNEESLLQSGVSRRVIDEMIDTTANRD